MSNLSELLPAGAGAKSADFVASGTLGSGVTVALKADGTVEAVASASTPAAIGSSVAFNSVDSNDMDITYSSANQKVIITYRDQDNNSYGTVVVGTVSGTSISFGSPVVYNSANSIDGAPVSDENTGKIVIFYRDQGNSERGTAKVGTISGTSISFGSAVVFNSGGASNYNSPVYDPDTQKVVNFYKDEPNSNYATAIVGTVSGTSISFGSEVVWQSGEAEFISATYDTSANKMVVAYRDNSNSNYGTAIVGTVSGTSISFGAKSVYNTGDSRYNAIAYDASSGSVVVAYQDFSNSSYGTAVVGTVSGTSISFGSEVVFDAYNPIDHISVADFAVGNVIVVSYERNDDSFYKVGTVSGNSITFDSRTNLVLAPAGQSIRDGVTVYDNGQEKIVFAYQQSSTAGKGIVFNPTYTTSNSADFIGITDQAIADTATGAVIVQGGVSEKLSGLTVGADYYVQSDGSLQSPTVSLPYNISGTVYDSVSFSVNAQESDPQDIAFNATGTKMFIIGANGDEVNEYTLSIAFDVSTSVFVDSFSVAAQNTTPTGLSFSADGTKMYVVGFGNANVFEYTLSVGFDVSTASYTQSFSIAAQGSWPRGITFNPDGTKMFVVEALSKIILEYALSTAYNVSTASFVSSSSVSATGGEPTGIAFNADGTKMFLSSTSTSRVDEYELSTAFLISTISYSQSFAITQDTSAQGVAFGNNGTKMFIIGGANDTVYQYSTGGGSVTSVPAGRALSSTSILLEG